MANGMRAQAEWPKGTVGRLPVPGGAVDRAYSVNCIYFWADPSVGLGELHRVLAPGGRLAITVRDKTRDAYLPFRPEPLAALLRDAGFEDVRVVPNGRPGHPLLCALGTR